MGMGIGSGRGEGKGRGRVDGGILEWVVGWVCGRGFFGSEFRKGV